MSFYNGRLLFTTEDICTIIKYYFSMLKKILPIRTLGCDIKERLEMSFF